MKEEYVVVRSRRQKRGASKAEINAWVGLNSAGLKKYIETRYPSTKGPPPRYNTASWKHIPLCHALVPRPQEQYVKDATDHSPIAAYLDILQQLQLHDVLLNE